MSTDEKTGLPKAPEGRTWTVRRPQVFDWDASGLPGLPLVVGLTPRGLYKYDLGYPVRAFNNPKSVYRAAKRSLKIREKAIAHDARRKAKVADLVGTYPPKKLGDK